MVKHVTLGSSLEAEKVLIYTRKQIFQGIVNMQGKRLFKYKCYINVCTEIHEELIPKEPIIKQSSSLLLGDKLEADAIEVYPSKLLKFKKEANYSSTHSIQESTSKGFTFAEISIPFRPFIDLVSHLLIQQ